MTGNDLARRYGEAIVEDLVGRGSFRASVVMLAASGMDFNAMTEAARAGILTGQGGASIAAAGLTSQDVLPYVRRAVLLCLPANDPTKETMR